MPYETPADYDGPRMTDGQRRLVESPETLRLVTGRVRWYSKCWPQYAAEIESAAWTAACMAAMRWPGPDRCAWSTYLIPRLKGRVWHAVEMAAVPHGYRRKGGGDGLARPRLLQGSDQIPGGDGELTYDCAAPDGCDPVGWEIESEEEVRHMARLVLGSGRKLSPVQHDAVLHEFLMAASRDEPYSKDSARKMAKHQAVCKLQYALRYRPEMDEADQATVAKGVAGNVAG